MIFPTLITRAALGFLKAGSSNWTPRIIYSYFICCAQYTGAFSCSFMVVQFCISQPRDFKLLKSQGDKSVIYRVTECQSVGKPRMGENKLSIFCLESLKRLAFFPICLLKPYRDLISCHAFVTTYSDLFL